MPHLDAQGPYAERGMHRRSYGAKRDDTRSDQSERPRV